MARCQETIRSLYTDPNRVLGPAQKCLQEIHFGFKMPENGLQLLVHASAHTWFAGGGRNPDPQANAFFDGPVDIKTAHGSQVFLEGISKVECKD